MFPIVQAFAGAEQAGAGAAVAVAIDVLFRRSNTASGWAFRNPRVRAVTARRSRRSPMAPARSIAGTPGTELGAAWIAADFVSVLGNVAGSLREQQRGLLRVHRDRARQEPVNRLTALVVERAGALIAGANDADSLWLGPAGLAHLAGDGRTELLFDVAHVAQDVDYTQSDSGGIRLAAVSNRQSGSPSPTVAATLVLSDRRVLASGLAAPHARTSTATPTKTPQRYASVILAGSALIYIMFGAAYRVIDSLHRPPVDRSDYNIM